MKLMLLNDGETYTDLKNCSIVQAPDNWFDLDDVEREEFLRGADAEYVFDDDTNLQKGTTAPASAPAKAGDIYVDTIANQAYIAVDTNSDEDAILTHQVNELTVEVFRDSDDRTKFWYYLSAASPDHGISWEMESESIFNTAEAALVRGCQDADERTQETPIDLGTFSHVTVQKVSVIDAPLFPEYGIEVDCRGGQPGRTVVFHLRMHGAQLQKINHAVLTVRGDHHV